MNMNLMQERAGTIATAVQAEVRGQIKRKLDELEHEMRERFREKFERYRQQVLNNIEVTHRTDITSQGSHLTFDIKINNEEIFGG